jgi:serine/threonine-protein kinase
MAPPQSRDTFRVGDLLNNTYRIEAVLGRGGTSEVYRARSEISGRAVALKVLKSELSVNADYLRLMTREEAIRDVRHDAVVRYSENHRTPEGHVYLIMDYVEGPTLDKLMGQGPIGAEDLLVIAQRVGEGLVAAHARRVVHRDLSPDNIILRGGKPDEAVIIDFGIAKDDRPGAETIVGNEFAGKYAYAAPEQLHGRTDARSDLYALGMTLLACFRGVAPDLGANPVEMLRIKELPPDTTGLPEPLKGFVDRLCAPDPAKRFQTAVEAVQALDPGFRDPSAARSPPPAATKVPEPAPPPPPPAPARRRGGLVALVLVALVAAAGGGGYAAGLFDRFLVPPVPVADPFVLTVTRAEGQPPAAQGFMPGPEALAALAAQMQALGGSSTATEATGAIPEGWAEAAARLIAAAAALPEWRLTIEGAKARITGTAPDRATRDTALAALTAPGPIGVSAEITFGPRILTAAAVAAIVDPLRDCGPLALDDPPAAGWGTGARIIVTGRVASEASRLAIYDALAAGIGDRSTTLDVEVLNPELCAVEAALPQAPSRGFQVVFGFGDRPDPNPAARYFVGENPVIDVMIPADVTEGNLWVSIVDVTGTVFHLLPNLNRPENDIPTLREGREGAVPLRVAYSLAEAQGTPRMAFLVDDSIMGKSKIVILYATEPVFDSLRPMSESVESFAAALAGQEDRDGLTTLFSVDTRILTTERP